MCFVFLRGCWGRTWVRAQADANRAVVAERGKAQGAGTLGGLTGYGSHRRRHPRGVMLVVVPAVSWRVGVRWDGVGWWAGEHLRGQEVGGGNPAFGQSIGQCSGEELRRRFDDLELVRGHASCAETETERRTAYGGKSES